MKINVVMVEPEIPQNTGNIARTCAATDSKLHLVHPLGFNISDKYLKRAGLDYWDKLEIYEYENLDENDKTKVDHLVENFENSDNIIRVRLIAKK